MKRLKLGYKICLYLALVVLLPSLGLADTHEPKICLTMVVVNNEFELEKCLESVKDVIDCYSICDLGSYDKSVKVIEAFMKKHKIPGKVHNHEWEDFGTNKTLAAQAAHETINELGYAPERTYLLVIDPEMRLKQGAGFTKNSLIADSYTVLEQSAAISYYQYDVHLLRASIEWKSNGVTHEFWSSKHPTQCEKLTTLMIKEQTDEKRIKEKLELDLKLLTQGLKDEPENKRYHFFMAQTHKCLKNYKEAIKWYQIRLKNEADRDEICFSKFMIGECFEEVENWDQALYWYLEAYQCNPDRVESIRKIATHYREASKNEIAYIFAKLGSRIPLPDEKILFHDPEFSYYRFEEELSISAYYTRFKEDGYEGIDNIILRRNMPWYVRDQSYLNILYYIDNLKNTRLRPIQLDLPLIREGFDDRYNPMNPSIYKTAQGYQVICRTVNYTQTGAKIFNTIDEHGIFRTRNFLLQYDKNFKLLTQQEIIEDLPRERIRTFSLEGLDDCRLFGYDNSLWFTCTTGDTNPYGNFQISLCKLANQGDGKNIHVEKLIPLLGPDPYRCEKNWLPFIRDNTLYLIYSCDPFQVYKPDLETGEYEIAFSYQPRHDFSGFRGSAPPVEFDNGYLMVVHEVVLRGDYTRCYLHRFVYLDHSFKIQQVSKPFTFLHQGVEFCCSMVPDHSDTQMILSIGIEDREAYLCLVDFDTIRSLLRPLPPLVHEPAFKPK